MINIAIADDQSLFRKGMVSLLNTFEGMQVMLEAENGQHLLQQLAAGDASLIQVVLLDINMPLLNGIETMKEVRALYPALKNIILTVHEEDKYISKLIEEGANAFLAKNTTPAELEKAITTVVSHDYYFNDHAIRAMHGHLQAKRQRFSRLPADDITSREKEVLRLICRELTAGEIAQHLSISERTVDGHRNSLLIKTGCRNTAGLVLFAIKHDLFDMNLHQ